MHHRFSKESAVGRKSALLERKAMWVGLECGCPVLVRHMREGRRIENSFDVNVSKTIFVTGK